MKRLLESTRLSLNPYRLTGGLAAPPIGVVDAAAPRLKYVPILASSNARAAISVIFAALLMVGRVPPGTFVLFVIAWLAGVLAAEKYVHKYPSRYVPYLLASHAKSSATTLAILWCASLLGTFDSWRPLLTAFVVMVVLDLVLSLPRRRLVSTGGPTFNSASAATSIGSPEVDTAKRRAQPKPSTDAVLNGLPAAVRSAVALVSGEQASPAAGVAVATGDQPPIESSDVVAVTTPLNDLRRINRLLLACTARMRPGAYLVCSYRPLEREKRGMLGAATVFLWHRACPKIPLIQRLYFMITGGRNRRLSRAEVWGRLASCGHRVVVERDGPSALVIARQESPVITNRRPSYYPIVGLTKVGLDGDILITHKIRSMFPFSEFIQKQVFDSNGLAAAGKISNDFRVTTYGRYLRRYWLDELPQLVDWWRGDLKLVGMRATSHHFLGLYPPDFISLYVQVKPGLIPPLFDDKTAGFEEIVTVEKQYLADYLQRPVQTDIINFYRTLRDIALRGVRSN